MDSKPYKYKKQKLVKAVPISVPYRSLNLISNQSENNVLKITNENDEKGTGFFCLIPFPDKFNQLLTLITNNHVLDKDDIKIGKIIKFSSEKQDYQIKIDEQRKCYTSEEYDTTIIEIKKEDGININKFLEIDEDIFNDNANEIFSKSSIYIMHYPNGNENQISFGVNKGISLNNIIILPQTQTLPGSSGSPIMNLLNYKIIGIHKGEDENRNWNLGTLLKLPIEKFKEEFCNKEDIKNNNNNNIINQNNSYIKNKENILKNKNEDIKVNNPKKENEFSLFNQILQENIYEDNKNKVEDDK